MIYRIRPEFIRHLVHPVNPVSKIPKKCTNHNSVNLATIFSFSPISTRSVSEEEVRENRDSRQGAKKEVLALKKVE